MTRQNTEQNGHPAWLVDLHEKYSAAVANVFVLHFNVSDLFRYTNPLRDYLGKAFGNREIVVFYNISEGLTFLRPSMHDAFVRELGLDQVAEGPQLPPGFERLAQAQARQQAQAEIEPTEIELPKSPREVLPLLEKLLRLSNEDGTKAAVIIDYAEALFPRGELAQMKTEDREAVVTLQRWARDTEIILSGNIVLLLTENLAELHPSLRAAGSRIESIMIPLPDYQERLDYINWMLEKHPNLKGLELEEGMTRETLTAATAGLGKIHIEDIGLRAKKAGQPITYELVKERKADIIKSQFGHLIEIIEPEGGFELVGGLEHVKRFLQNSVIEPLRRGEPQDCPMGVLFMGPAGTGKSIIAEALAHESGFNCINLNLGRLLSKWVGESESNLERALLCIETLAPTVVVIDEVDQRLKRITSGASGGDRVMGNIFGRMLEFMSDESHKGRVVFLAITNRPDNLDAALKRPGRFDRKVLFPVPEPEEIPDIIAALCRRNRVPPIDLRQANDPRSLGEALNGRTGAELQSVVNKAIELAKRERRKHPTADDLVRAAGFIRPTTQAIEFMTAIALLEADDGELVPERYRELWQDTEKLRQMVEADRPRD